MAAATQGSRSPDRQVTRVANWFAAGRFLVASCRKVDVILLPQPAARDQRRGGEASSLSISAAGSGLLNR